MSRHGSLLPDPLRATDATDLERRLLNAAARENPSRELTERMASALGVAAPPLDVAADGTGTGSVAPKAAVGSNAILPWLAGAIVAAAVVGAVVVSPSSPSPVPARSAAPAVSSHSPALPAPAPRAEVSAAEGRSELVQPAREQELAPSASAPPRSQPTRESPRRVDLGEQIALVDSARDAVSAGAGQRALSILRQYEERYPVGSFRPEAAALRIEALVTLGRRAEARKLAERFVAQQGGSPLADRVARVAGLRP